MNKKSNGFLPVGGEQATLFLQAWRNGDEEALGKLIDLVYSELYQLARLRFVNERTDHTLQPTALINELYMRLLGEQSLVWQDRAHFLGVAAHMMRRILIDHARKQRAARRGDGVRDLTLENVIFSGGDSDGLVDLLALDEALTQLGETDEVQARVVELRYFAGLTVEETAEVLGVTDRTVKRKWAAARAWLFHLLKKKE